MAWLHVVVMAALFCTAMSAYLQDAFDVLDLPGDSTRVHFSPYFIEELVQDEYTTIFYNVTVKPESGKQITELLIEIEDNNIVQLVTNNTIVIDTGDLDTFSGNVTIKGLFLGRTYLSFYYSSPDGVTPSGDALTSSNWALADYHYHIAVIRPKRVLDTIFIAVVAIVVLVPKVGMGCKLDLKVVREVLKKPFAPIIGFICQFIIMPAIAYGIIELLDMEGGLALGYFAAGCAPGGGASNFYAYLLKGDISLSITMTAVSTVASLGMIPLWMFTLGRILLKRSGSHVKVPFLNICITLISIVLPVGIGVLLQYKAPHCAKMFGKALRPIMLLFLIFLMTFGVYVNLYVFKLYTWRLVLAGCLLPYIGFVLGAVVALVCRQPRKRVITIALETGVQNLGIAILLMKLSLPQPDADLSLLSPIMVGTFGPLPLLVAVIVLEIRKRCCKKEEKDEDKRPTDQRNGDIKEEEVELNAPLADSDNKTHS